MRARVEYCALGIFLVSLAAVAGAEEIQITDTLPGTFIDISSSGTDLHLDDEGWAEITTTIGNSLLPAGQVVISNNGGVGFAPSDPTLAPGNEPIPSTSAFGGGQALLPYWDDIGNDVGGVLFEERDNALIIQWNDRLIGGTRARVTFQIQVFDASEATNPYFQFLYQSISGAGGGLSATIGYQDGGTGHNDTQWSYNALGAVTDGSVLSVMPEPASLVPPLLSVLVLRRRA